MRKTIWMPLVLGFVLGALSFFSSAVHWVIPIGSAGAIGPHEIFAVLAAALGGPVGLLVASSLHTLGAHLFLMQFPPEFAAQALPISLGDYIARTLALLAVAYGFRWLHQRARRALAFFAGWLLIVVVYYALLLPLQALDWAIFLPGMLPLSALIQGAPPEFLMVAIVTALIWVALPARYGKPLWIEEPPVPPPAGGKA